MQIIPEHGVLLPSLSKVICVTQPLKKLCFIACLNFFAPINHVYKADLVL